ncbi:Asp-tRNA(Asn)/Glu-tRNA(Gln) amidotransferase subunit GatC [Puniceicoccus vermicola]|uniref:Aspartyl/glutamyl-tRNA(Asn/Gln) amidotransferase subunit C n=1 Tax=Puniceicoccus vermicola TaxID=388746 RepID=A0A7X1AXU4_9BACT|nr:Asp-tRNA(Asn)/Glu-tRNA(Gln) amidotransferase subunit GatC [Puniceicoccus vermicola]MBC2601877.1 Asp-tRNA(Asn)/Glu-tRNA(Gln) amidotransferase subunit GatC [Puniceicoccus vermicola]
MNSEESIDLDRLCVLARLSLEPEEKEKLGPQLARIIGYVEQLKEVDVDGVEPMAHAIPLENVLRKDEAAELVDRETYLRNAPDSRAHQVVVPPVIEG